MTTARARPLHPVSFLRALRARPRLLGCAAFGLALYAIACSLGHATAATALVAWNAGALLYLLLAWHAMLTTDVQGIRDRAVRQDEGSYSILILVVLAALAVLLAVGTQLADVKDMHGN